MSFSFPVRSSERLSSPTINRPAIIGASIIGALGALTAYESAATYQNAKHLDDQIDILSDERDGGHPTYVLPGCRMDGRFLASALGPHLAGLGSTHTVVYPEKGFPFDQLRDKILETRQHEKDRPASFYVFSMGGIVLSHLLADPEFRREMGTINTVLFDSSPSGVEDLTAYSHRAQMAASALPPTRSINRLYSYVMTRNAQKRDDERVREHMLTTAKTPLAAVHSQAQLIGDKKSGDGDFVEAYANVRDLIYLSATDDGVADPYRSVESYRAKTGRNIRHIIDDARPSPSHAAGAEYPRTAVELLGGNSYGAADLRSNFARNALTYAE